MHLLYTIKSAQWVPEMGKKQCKALSPALHWCAVLLANELYIRECNTQANTEPGEHNIPPLCSGQLLLQEPKAVSVHWRDVIGCDGQLTSGQSIIFGSSVQMRYY